MLSRQGSIEDCARSVIGPAECRSNSSLAVSPRDRFSMAMSGSEWSVSKVSRSILLLRCTSTTPCSIVIYFQSSADCQALLSRASHEAVAA